MGLRLKFLLLILGLFITPMLLMTSYVLFKVESGLNASPYEQTLLSLQEAIKQEPNGEIYTSHLIELINGDPTDVLIYSDNRILNSTMEDFPSETLVNSDVLFSQLTLNYEDLFILDYSAYKPGALYIVAFEDSLIGNKQISLMKFMQYPYFFGSLFVCLMAIFIIRSINKSVLKLRKATERVSKGDLDFELEWKKTDEFSELAASFDNMRAQLKEQYARSSRFLMGVSHDLKTPLAAINGYIEALSDGMADTPEKEEKYLGIIKSNSILLENRISHLIQFAKLETQEWRSNLKEDDLVSLMNELSDRYTEESQILHYHFQYKSAFNKPVIILMDRELIYRALENLIQNAIRYSSGDKTVGVNFYTYDNHYRIDVSNKGKVIDPKNMTKIYEPFFRESPGRNEQGLGLGLASVKFIVETHGWKIHVSSTKAEEETEATTIFSILIPYQE